MLRQLALDKTTLHQLCLEEAHRFWMTSARKVYEWGDKLRKPVLAGHMREWVCLACETINPLMMDLPLLHLTSAYRVTLDQAFKLDEFGKALVDLSAGKTPGQLSGGILLEFET
ncbi:hypothetical protein NDU88_002472 [Pleurodeles waltl]|uniref:Uncharacterized protein n=1 Tax=Pleurodeles waltl TaxID=8319 RepID=A0AAV7U9T9_PLEWA|nr:hypothetical protein NDU88_002472 [Pleurodeles waltl]